MEKKALLWLMGRGVCTLIGWGLQPEDAIFVLGVGGARSSGVISSTYD